MGQQKQLKEHVRKVHNSLSHKCEHCGKSFSGERGLSMHIRSCHTTEPVTYKCDHCDKELFTLKGMALHRASNHPDETTKVYYCDSCTFTSLNQTSFRKHVKKYHN